ncbi:MAG: transglycosylase SLT domain-containing protein [Desulfovibrio sp.]|nr:transglycosylase SLT domain-containing protein [Desulfovibrio sp.]
MSTRQTLFALTFCMAVCLLLLGLLSGFVPQVEGPNLRRAASWVVVSKANLEEPPAIESKGSAGRRWSLRRTASFNVLSEPQENNKTNARQGAVQFAEHEVFLVLGQVSSKAKTEKMVQTPLLQLDGFSMPTLVNVQPESLAETLTESGAPLRWYQDETLVAGYTPLHRRRLRLVKALLEKAILESRIKSAGKGQVVVKKLFVPRSLPVTGQGLERAQAFQYLVKNFARQHGLDPSLVNAIIYSESNFNTGTVSPRSAVGLMQVLPSTAAVDIHRFLHGKTGQISPSQLFDPATNIRYGTAYLRILRDQYFGQIQNALAREYCMVAAYNMGPKRVLKVFGSEPGLALQNINSLSPEQVYETLISRLPKQETRNYVAKVRGLKQQYERLNGGK